MKPEETNILVVEDDYLVSEDIIQILKRLGYRIIGDGSNGKEAIELTASLKPNVVLMDIHMPEMDGLEAARHIQEKCPTPVVILTAHESFDLVEEASAAGVGAYLTKPPDPLAMERAISIAIARHGDLMRTRQLLHDLKAAQEAETLAREAEKNAELKAENLKTTGMMAATIAHEFNNPLAIIKGTADLIEMGNKDVEKLSKQMQTIHKQVERMKILVDKIMKMKEIKEIDYANGHKMLDIHQNDE